MLTIILIILILILIILFFLYIGIEVKIEYKIKNTKFNILINLKFLNFNLFKKEIPKEKNEKKDNSQVKNKKSIYEKYNEIKPLLITIKKSKKELINYLKIFYNSITLKKFNNYMEIGLSNYVDTAEIIGLISVLNIFPNLSDKIFLKTEPKFGEEILFVKGELYFKISLLKPILGILKLITYKNIREIIKKIIELRKSNEDSNEIW